MLAMLPGMALAAEQGDDSAAVSDTSVSVNNDEPAAVNEDEAVDADDEEATTEEEASEKSEETENASETTSTTTTTGATDTTSTTLKDQLDQKVQEKLQETAGKVVSAVAGLIVEANPGVDPATVAGLVGNTVNSVITDVAQKFEDVRSGAWYESAVKFVKEKGLMSGVTDSSFAPNSEATRAMLMKVLASLKGVDTTGGATWYEKAMQWAVANGISDGSNINDNITREELATMLYRFAGSPDVEGTLSGFEDSAAVQEYAQQAMIWAVQNGLITGNDDGTLNPDGNATRAEVAAILMRFCENFAQQA
jgi:hypothetical protein